MARTKLLIGTDVVLDFLNRRKPFYERARLLFICGRMGEFELWMSSSQVIDLVYGLSDGSSGECTEDIRECLRGLRTFVNVFPVSDREIDLMLAAAWKDPEDYLLVEVALALKADAIVTRNQKDFPQGLVKVIDCNEFFAWMKDERGLVYDEMLL